MLKPPQNKLALLAVALMVVLLAGDVYVGKGLQGRQGLARETFQVPVGRSHVMTLADGSVLELHPKSVLEMNVSGPLREVWMHRGGAHFRVSHDEARPFRVNVAGAVIEDLGTQFDVLLRSADTQVTVTEGQVRITGNLPSHALEDLSAGDMAQILPDGQIVVARGAASAGAVVSEDAQVEFSRATLSEVVETFNRSNRSPHLVVEGQACTMPVSARLSLVNPQSLLGLLERADDLTLLREGERTIIRKRGELISADTDSSCHGSGAGGK